ncbi:hypothetical protein CROQUDRAFT_657559 [Cronartium quercuum f. sp. fusiforme G11]|uniref:Uncharacterized protein n=1 Tax=Cronartium quercuum f. sp. fusiforme G11 TaxID=708437 RepID=A0A9P6NLC1_9BASI|nr:hypothetical protein CROQUDRAFT_657559 [Cronartium quercuum f. sp. fusiforme G11]
MINPQHLGNLNGQVWEMTALAFIGFFEHEILEFRTKVCDHNYVQADKATGGEIVQPSYLTARTFSNLVGYASPKNKRDSPDDGGCKPKVNVAHIESPKSHHAGVPVPGQNNSSNDDDADSGPDSSDEGVYSGPNRPGKPTSEGPAGDLPNPHVESPTDHDSPNYNDGRYTKPDTQTGQPAQDSNDDGLHQTSSKNPS